MSEPNIVDAAAAMPEVSDLLSAIFQHQQNEREHFDNLMQTYHGQDKGRLFFIVHGVNHVLDTYEWGGTSREYEDVIYRIANIVACTGYGMFGHIYEWYQETYKDPVMTLPWENIHPEFRGRDRGM